PGTRTDRDASKALVDEPLAARWWQRPNLMLAAAAAVVALAHVALVFLRHGPILVADEIGYLTNARVLAGGVGGQLAGAGFTHGGYSLLLVPFVRLGSPLAAYRLVLLLNVLLVASLIPLLYLLLRRTL